MRARAGVYACACACANGWVNREIYHIGISIRTRSRTPNHSHTRTRVCNSHFALAFAVEFQTPSRKPGRGSSKRSSSASTPKNAPPNPLETQREHNTSVRIPTAHLKITTAKLDRPTPQIRSAEPSHIGIISRSQLRSQARNVSTRNRN